VDNQPVLACNFGQGHKWLKDEIVKSTSPVSSLIKLQKQLKYNQDQIRKQIKTTSTNITMTDHSDEESLSAPAVVSDSVSSNTVAFHARHYPQWEHCLPVRYHDSSNSFSFLLYTLCFLLFLCYRCYCMKGEEEM